MSLKRDFLDAAYSDLIREAADWTCQRCSKPFPERKSQGLHASHFISRGAGNAVRWCIDNALALCGACHDRMGKYPDEHTALFKRVMGDVRYGELQLAKHRIVKYTKQDKKAMAAHFRSEIERIKRRREKGECGYITPVGWE